MIIMIIMIMIMIIMIDTVNLTAALGGILCCSKVETTRLAVTRNNQSCAPSGWLAAVFPHAHGP